MKIETPSMADFLEEEFMKPMGISSYRLSHDIGVPVSRIQEILKGTRKVTVDTSLRLGKYFGVSDRFFLNLQNDIDVRNTKQNIKKELDKIQKIAAL